MPIIGRIALSLAIIGLGAGVLYVGAGGLGKVAGTLGTTLTGFVDDVTATPSPIPSVAVVSGTPSLDPPDEPYTNSSQVDLVVTVPAAMVGDATHRIRVYLALKDQKSTAIMEVPIGPTAKTAVPVELTKGINDFSVSIVGDGTESESSAIARYVLDTSKPKVTITSPKANAVVNGKSVTIKGKVQGRSTLLARNDTNGATSAGTAASDGTFSLALPITTGSNTITIDATDPAGNAGTASLTVRRGNGKLTVSLAASAYQVSRKGLPTAIRLTATATDPDGRPLSGAEVTFTLSIPGIKTVTWDGTTKSNGRAEWQTTIPKGATVGQGSATALVTADGLGSTQDYTVITVVK
jgi:Glucodextranase, domain B